MTSLTLTAKAPVTDTIWSLEFTAPQLISWDPGQFIKLTVPHADADPAGTSRFYTIASAPHEAVIRIVTRQGRSSFKQALFSLDLGETAQLTGFPAGDVVWGHHDRPRVLVASGVGITPFYAMLKHQARQGIRTPVEVVYFHPHTSLPFADEFASWQQANSLLSVTCLRDQYSPEQLAAHVRALKDSTVYLSGPMSPTKLLLPPYNLKPGQILRDSFTGYSAADY